MNSATDVDAVVINGNEVNSAAVDLNPIEPLAVTPQNASDNLDFMIVAEAAAEQATSGKKWLYFSALKS